MPLYEYELCEGDCKICGGKFTLNRPLSAKPLTNCPACKKPVRKIISNFSSPHKLKPVSFRTRRKPVFRSIKNSARANTNGSKPCAAVRRSPQLGILEECGGLPDRRSVNP